MPSRAPWSRLLSLAAACSLVLAADGQERPAAEPRPAPRRIEAFPRHSFELAVSDDSVRGEYLRALGEGKSRFSLAFLGNADDDYLGSLQLMRFGEPSTDLPLELGLGLGFYAGRVDAPDADVYALTIGGAARYRFDTAFPTSVGFTLHFAPDATAFGDGERLIDLVARCELDVSSFATAFVGYRLVEADVGNGREPDFDRGFHVGVRIGL